MADEPARQVGPASQPTSHAKMRVHAAARAAEAAPWPWASDAIEAAGVTSDATGFLQVMWLINGVKIYLRIIDRNKYFCSYGVKLWEPQEPPREHFGAQIVGICRDYRFDKILNGLGYPRLVKTHLQVANPDCQGCDRKSDVCLIYIYIQQHLIGQTRHVSPVSYIFAIHGSDRLGSRKCKVPGLFPKSEASVGLSVVVAELEARTLKAAQGFKHWKSPMDRTWLWGQNQT